MTKARFTGRWSWTKSAAKRRISKAKSKPRYKRYTFSIRKVRSKKDWFDKPKGSVGYAIFARKK